MIIYIHGFGSSGFGGKATLFKEYFKDEIIAPSLSYVPALAIHTLEQLIEIFLKKGESISLIGSSLGGYYSIYLAEKYGLKAVLINPAIYPYKLLDKLGMATNYFDLSKFECNDTHINALKFLEPKELKNQKNYMLLLQKGDETLNYQEAIDKLPNSKIFLEEEGSHSFDGIQRYFKTIEEFIL